MIKYRTHLLSAVIALLGFVDIFGQQPGQFTMNMLDKYRSNPAYAGMDASLVVTGAFKSQWESYPGSPSYQNVTAHMPLYIAQGGIGFQFIHDAIGVEETLGFQASYNFVKESDYGLFSTGLGLGLVQKSLDGSKLRTPQGIYEGINIEHLDPILSNIFGRGIAPTSTFGLYFANDYIEAGIAIDQIFNNEVRLTNAEQTRFRLKRYYSGFVEYGYVINDLIQIFPSVFVKSDGVQTQVDLSTRFDYTDVYFGGMTFRGYSANTIDALAIFAGARVSAQWSVAYAYDITLSAIRTYSEGTHEFVVRYNLGKPIGVGKPEHIIYNPRF